MGRALKYDIPGRDLRVPLELLREAGVAAAFAPDLAPPLQLVVEIGFGRGEFLRQLASEAPEVAHLGVELSFKRVLKMARRLAPGDEGNIRLVEATGEQVVHEILEPASVSAFWINFPDPWPKKRHHPRRLVQPALLEGLARCLLPGGELQLATDHVEYALHIEAVLRGQSLLENTVAPARFLRDVPGRMHTAYESEWRKEGRPLHFFSYRRPALELGGGAPKPRHPATPQGGAHGAVLE